MVVLSELNLFRLERGSIQLGFLHIRSQVYDVAGDLDGHDRRFEQLVVLRNYPHGFCYDCGDVDFCR